MWFFNFYFQDRNYHTEIEKVSMGIRPGKGEINKEVIGN